ncbi:MAG: NOL1/NOP2/sun family putative RNA methylase, partial [Candidatus Aenigmarchaeota archaeon]|nr:NOL1/NOP2/sun family putative RNA methylase [Candidatus Aenigmarchaeota archaeon]
NGLIIDYESSSKTMEYFLGYYHIQEAASMIPPLVLNPKPGEKILDMCASPGSKTTQVAMMMKNKGTIISNDDNFKRLRPLAFNIQKMGVMNSVVTNYDARSFWRFGLKFDRILLDAPCTNSGIIFKDDVVKKMWSERGIKKLSRIQKELIKSAYISLKENGILVYSTCSFEPEENEEVVQYAIENFRLKLEKIKIPKLKSHAGVAEWNEKQFDSSVSNCIRLFPRDEIGEGFFICKLKKY